MATGSSQNGLRADARHNRDRILDAARDAFAERGADVPMAAIARRAGVGAATLYRRFPTRAALVAEVFSEQLDGCGRVLDNALAEGDPWTGFRRFVLVVFETQVSDHGFTAALLTEVPDAVDFERARCRVERGFAELVRRAKEAGALRADFSPADLGLVLMAAQGVTATAPTRAAAVAASHRLAAFLLESFRADGRDTAECLPPPVPMDLVSMAETCVSGRA